MYTAGSNQFGQLMTGDFINRYTPFLTSFTSALSISAGRCVLPFGGVSLWKLKCLVAVPIPLFMPSRPFLPVVVGKVPRAGVVGKVPLGVLVGKVPLGVLAGTT